MASCRSRVTSDDAKGHPDCNLLMEGRRWPLAAEWDLPAQRLPGTDGCGVVWLSRIQCGRFAMIRMFETRRLATAVVSQSGSRPARQGSSTTTDVLRLTPVTRQPRRSETSHPLLAVGGSVFYSFNFVACGNYAVTLVSGGGLDDGQTRIGISRAGPRCRAGIAAPWARRKWLVSAGPGICVRVAVRVSARRSRSL